MRGLRVSPIAAAVVVAVFLLITVVLAAVSKKDAKYIGSEKCKACHVSSHKALVDGYLATPHHSAMTDVTVKPEAIVAKFDASSPVKKADIKYVLGTGKGYQNFLDKDLKLLPGKWDVASQKWVPTQAEDGATQCVGCHTTNFNAEAKTWTELGVGCEDCHGPGATHADSMDAADIVTLKKMDSKKKDMVCGQCHGQGKDITGKYAFSTTYLPGDDLSASFKVNPPTPGAANSQYNDFITSKHEAGGMMCVSCHDAHGNKAKGAHQLLKPVNELCLECHGATIGTMKDHAPTAKPGDTCATCHMVHGAHTFTKPGK